MTKTTFLHETQLQHILDKVKVIDEQTYEVDGKPIKVYHQQSHTQYTQDLADFGRHDTREETQLKKTFIQHLSGTLYSRFYCGMPSTETFKMPSKLERNQFMNALSQANCSTQNPDPNWKVYTVQPNGMGAFAEKNGQLRPVQPNTYVVNPQQPQLSVNQTIQFVRQKENREAQSVFYYVFGNEYLQPDCSMVRIYWNIQPSGAPLLIQQLTTILNDYRIPFNFKCLNHPDLYQRSDAAVLYFDKDNIAIISMLLPGIIEAVKAHLSPSSPYFTDVLHAGVSRAEDPGNGQSFGMSRCNTIAEAIYLGYENKIKSKDRMNHLKKTLQRKGIDSTQMSINPHTKHFLLRV